MKKKALISLCSIAIPITSFVFAISASGCGSVSKKKNPIIYEIYPMSYQDTDNAGYHWSGWNNDRNEDYAMGDLKGVIQHLDYIKSLHVDYIWLAPIFTSTFYDNGYDITDFYHVDPRFGTDNDLKELIRQAKQRGLKIMLDMVFNHTSTECEWFTKWAAGDPQYADYYIGTHSATQPDPELNSFFQGKAWLKAPSGNNLWFFHLYTTMQADLNWNNPKVVNELKHILKYYVNMGVEGFRFDSFEEVDKTLLPDAQAHPNNNRYDFTHGPNIDKMYHQIFQGLPSNIYLLGEIDSNTGDDFYKHTDQTKTFDAVYTDDMNSFNSDLYNEDDQANINQIINLYNKLTTYSNLKGTIAKLFECHDNHHPINRFVGWDNPNLRPYIATICNGLMATLPGPNILYQGQEIGQANTLWDNIDDHRDIVDWVSYQANGFTNKIKNASRDNSRTPMAWDNSTYGGFTSGPQKPWLWGSSTIQPDISMNVANEENDVNSPLNFTRELNNLIQKNVVFQDGNIQFDLYNDSTHIIAYTLNNGRQSFKVYCNFDTNVQPLNYDHNKVLLANYSNNLNGLQPYQFLILQN